jgi:DNA-binding response OmpR family regulator
MLDISMPLMRGDEMLERLRAEGVHGDPAVIVVSSVRAGDQVTRMQELGARILPKPFAPEQLYSVLLNISELRDAITA